MMKCHHKQQRKKEREERQRSQSSGNNIQFSMDREDRNKMEYMKLKKEFSFLQIGFISCTKENFVKIKKRGPIRPKQVMKKTMKNIKIKGN